MVVSVAIAGAGAATVYVVARRSDRPPPIDVALSDIVKVQAYPVPEGTPPPPLVLHPADGSNERPLSEVRTDIPSPLPAPVRCDYSGFGDGLQLSIFLHDGRRLDYFACAFPDELKALSDDAWP